MSRNVRLFLLFQLHFIACDHGLHALESVSFGCEGGAFALFPKQCIEHRRAVCYFDHECALLTVYSQFLASHYKSIKASNPNLPFLVREAQGVPARLFVRLGMYGFESLPLQVLTQS